MRVNTRKLLLLMANKSMSAEKLAEASGVSGASLSKIKSGKRTARPSTLGKIATALECKVEDFISED